ncbi:MAG: GH32 C-terminal domain-containing protein [Prevotella sp.]|jgi:fructan beta-fructosidase
MKSFKIIFAALLLAPVAAQAQTMDIQRHGDTTIVNITNPTKYLLLPVEEDQPESQVMLYTNNAADTWMDVRLAQNKIDYYVPFKLGNGFNATVKILNLKPNALALQSGQMQLSNTWDVTNTDFYRPTYHFTPAYGWMNDPNGMIYKDGEYHLYFQYNPYGSKWGNMHWGHAISKDLFHWKQLDPAIARDTLGHIFSGSSVIDRNNTAGYGKNAIVAFYTSASDKNGQIQCMAWSVDNGRTFTKYTGNPVLTPFDGLKDFRDPKVFWYAPMNKWYMIVSADKEMRFYSSNNLRDWDYVSAFGKGYGQQPNQFECPDFFELPVDGNENNKKWVMIVNINPGCLFGGSATEYFVGDFDGKTFKCDTDPKVVKWLDFGKDHYACVTMGNTPGRVIALPWMSNWQYANVTPIKQYRGANALPRELKLYTKDGQIYLSAKVVEEANDLRKETLNIGNVNATKKGIVKQLPDNYGYAYEVDFDVTPSKRGETGITLYNDKGEEVKIYFDMKKNRVVMDRTKSGLTDFGKLAQPHEIEANYDVHQFKDKNKKFRMVNSVNYQNDFALGTWAPLNLCEGKTYKVRLMIDKCSVEMFIDGGRIPMTNLVFPTAPYNKLNFHSTDGKGTFKGVEAHRLSL